LLIYFLSSILVFNKFDYILDLFFLPLSLIVFTGAGVGINYIEEKNQNTLITEAFGKYVNKHLLDEMISKKSEIKLGGEKRDITVFFSDIRDFTSVSEKLFPEELANLINSYLTTMAKIILDNNGTIDKFIGDAIMSFWNAPLEKKDHSFLACKSAIEQIKSLKEFNQKDSDKKPKLRMGCGIHTGEAIVGNFGSHHRFNYTALGDTVNLSSRLEGLTKYYKIPIIISESTQKLVRTNFDFRKLDMVKVKGKEKPVSIYELCIEKDTDLVEKFENALDLYFFFNTSTN